MSYRAEEITEANFYYREGTWTGKDVKGFHVGVVVKTNKGNKYLIHHVPGKYPIVTDAGMSSKWKSLCSLKVDPKVTIGAVMTACGHVMWSFVGWNHCVSCAQKAARAISNLNNSDYLTMAIEAWLGKTTVKALQATDVKWHAD